MDLKGALSSGGACAVLSCAAILVMASGYAEARSHRYDVKSSSLTGGDRKSAPQPAVDAPAILGSVSSLRVQNIRLESAPPAPLPPSSTLKFEMLNDGASRLTNIVVEVSVNRVRKDDSNLPPDVLVRPFLVREKVVLLPGYSIEYEVRFQNLAPDCECVPRVEVVSVEALAESAPSR
jgi:hypothetical protein